MKPTIENEAIAATVLLVGAFLVASVLIGALACRLFKSFDDELKSNFETLTERNRK